MRIVAVADTHMFVEDLGTLPEGDVLVHAGDLLRAGTLDELERAAPWFRDQPHAHKIFVAGNHDGCFERDRARAVELLGPEVIYLQDSGAEVAGLSVWGSPWQPAYNDWAFNLERGAPLRAYWDLIPPGLDLLITHGPPAGFGDAHPYPERAGCEDLMEAVRRARPRLHVFGHIHNDGGCWRDGDVTLANVTTWECERGASVFDVTPGGVTPVVVPPRGE